MIVGTAYKRYHRPWKEFLFHQALVFTFSLRLSLGVYEGREKKRKEKIAQERKEEKGKDAYFVWEFNERKEKKYLSLI